MAKKKSNSAKGRESYDANIGDSIIPFFNRNSSKYPTEVGGPKLEMIPVEKRKDMMVNVARLHAKQEYDRIMEVVKVLEKQARDIQWRLEVTDGVHAAEYDFETYHNKIYWLVYHTGKEKHILSILGPDDWSSRPPEEYEYVTRVKWLGDYTWIEVGEDGESYTPPPQESP